MWSKLLKLLGSTPVETTPVLPEQEAPEITTSNMDNSRDLSGPSSLIGYNYIKRKGEDEEVNIKPRRFTNLNELLRGGYKDDGEAP